MYTSAVHRVARLSAACRRGKRERRARPSCTCRAQTAESSFLCGFSCLECCFGPLMLKKSVTLAFKKNKHRRDERPARKAVSVSQRDLAIRLRRAQAGASTLRALERSCFGGFPSALSCRDLTSRRRQDHRARGESSRRI